VDKYLQMLHPVTAVLHWKVLSWLQGYNVQTVLDIGGVGKLTALSPHDVTEVNLTGGVDGCDLPYENESFDATVSVATLEHVHDHTAFIKEAYRVARKVTVHWFPMGANALKVEELKAKYGHWHPCRLPTFDEIQSVQTIRPWKIFRFMNCTEQLLMCMTLTLALKNAEVYDFIIENGDAWYGSVLIGEK